MNSRELHLLSMRPEIASARVSDNMTEEERFQNQTLRPAIKLQKDLLLEAFRNYVRKHKNIFYDLTIEKRLDYIENSIQKDTKFRNSLKGMIIGQFTLKEYRRYIQSSSKLNKRMMGIVIEKIKANIQLLEPMEKVF